METIRRNLPLVALLLAIAPLAVALGAQYLGGLAPCPLCHWQRYPYLVAAAFAVVAFLVAPSGIVRWLVALAILAMLTSAAIGVFHVGVEQKWWEGTAGCTGGIDFEGMTVEEMQKALQDTAPARCDEPAWTFLGISMAGYNILYGAIAALLLAMALRSRKTGTTE